MCVHVVLERACVPRGGSDTTIAWSADSNSSTQQNIDAAKHRHSKTSKFINAAKHQSCVCRLYLHLVERVGEAADNVRLVRDDHGAPGRARQAELLSKLRRGGEKEVRSRCIGKGGRAVRSGPETWPKAVGWVFCPV